MSFLSKIEIEAGISSGEIRIDPFKLELMKPASLTLCLGNRSRRFKKQDSVIEVWSPSKSHDFFENVECGPDLLIVPGEMVLAATVEKVGLAHHLLGIISTLSHLARIGLSVHRNSFVVNPGFGIEEPTELALELTSCNPNTLVLRAGMPMCHLLVARIQPGIDSSKYRSPFDGEDPLLGSMIFEEFSKSIN
jgi:dCTP deaminase